MEEILLYFSIKYKGDFQKILNAIKTKETVNEKEKKELISKINCKYTTIVSDDYPEELKKINTPPFVLYYYGNLDLVKSNCVAITGLKEPTSYGVEATKEFVKGLVANGQTIISGLALGTETIAIKETLKENGRVIVLLGNGIERCFPKQNEDIYMELMQDNFIISEYPMNVEQSQTKLKFRKRLISGLCKSLLIIESDLNKMQDMDFLIYYACEQGKDVYAIPSNIGNNNFNNELIKNGCEIATNFNDILE